VALLKQLLQDLKQRCGFLEVTLGGITGLRPDAEAYRQRIAAILHAGRVHIERLAADPTLGQAVLRKNHFHQYKRLSELVSAAEWGPVNALKRFRLPDDAFMTSIAGRICKEIGYRWAPPLCVAGGLGHYWVNAGMDLIVTPVCEAAHLLGLTDLYHELGHIVILRESRALQLAFHRTIDQHFADSIRQARQDGKGPAVIDNLKKLQSSWKDWLIEFTADMIAAYVAGPAYGWTNVRLCMNQSSNAIYHASDSHPADAARTLGIELVLRSLGFANEATEIRASWDEFVDLSGSTTPPTFAVEYPRPLLDRLATFVVAGCRTLGLISLDQQPTGTSGSSIHVTKLLHEAWGRFQTDPAGFGAWEGQQVSDLKQEFGL